MKLEDLSLWQQKMLKYVSREPNRCDTQIAGKNRAPHISACRALVRKGLAWSFYTGCYSASDEGRAVVAEWCKRTKTVLKPLY